jgi:hypothetical protein
LFLNNSQEDLISMRERCNDAAVCALCDISFPG